MKRNNNKRKKITLKQKQWKLEYQMGKASTRTTTRKISVGGELLLERKLLKRRLRLNA